MPLSMTLYGDIFNDLHGPLTRFSRSRHFLKSDVSKTVRHMDKVTVAHERKPYLTYGMVPCLLILTDLYTRRAVCHR